MAPISTPSHKNKTVCVIGPSRLQNELIARCLEEQGDVKSAAVTSLNEARVRFGDLYGRIKLFLWDCGGKDLARETEVLKSVEGLIPRSSYLGLFNVDRKSWHDGMALPRQVKGVFFEDSSVEDLTIGLRILLRGRSCFPVKETAQDPVPGETCAGGTKSRDESLTPREHLLLSLITQEKTNQQIADALLVKYKTVKNCANRLFKKINVSNRVEARLWAKKHSR